MKFVRAFNAQSLATPLLACQASDMPYAWVLRCPFGMASCIAATAVTRSGTPGESLRTEHNTEKLTVAFDCAPHGLQWKVALMHASMAIRETDKPTSLTSKFEVEAKDVHRLQQHEHLVLSFTLHLKVERKC